jgi:hypothetical protein
MTTANEASVPANDAATPIGTGFPMPPGKSPDAGESGAPSPSSAARPLPDVAYEPRVLRTHGSSVVPADIQTVFIAGTSIVSHLEERPFTLYQLHVPLLSGEAVAFRRYSDFVALDERLGAELHGSTPRAPCLFHRELPALPPKTAFWQDATTYAVVTAR